jgi:predicted glycosyltransferase involved in capsule biosynthesis
MITFVTHLRYDSPDRLKNLETVINYYSSNLLDVKFIFIEDDKEHHKAFDNFPFIKGITSFNFVKNDHTYYRTRALNIGIKMAQSDIVVSLDTDCIVPIDSIKKCAKELRDGATVAWPYNGYFIDTSFETHNLFIRTHYDYNLLLSGLEENYQMPLSSSYKGYHVRCTSSDHLGTGGIVMFNKDLFIKTGGYNENFIGWGCEDNEIVTRLNKLNHKTYRDTNIKSICFHLFHRNAQRAENPFFQHNSNEWDKIKKINKEDLEKYISTWRQFK